MKYVNPPKRVKMFEHLKDNMTKIFTERLNLVKKQWTKILLIGIHVNGF